MEEEGSSSSVSKDYGPNEGYATENEDHSGVSKFPERWARFNVSNLVMFPCIGLKNTGSLVGGSKISHEIWVICTMLARWRGWGGGWGVRGMLPWENLKCSVLHSESFGSIWNHLMYPHLQFLVYMIVKVYTWRSFKTLKIKWSCAFTSVDKQASCDKVNRFQLLIKSKEYTDSIQCWIQ